MTRVAGLWASFRKKIKKMNEPFFSKGHFVTKKRLDLEVLHVIFMFYVLLMYSNYQVELVFFCRKVRYLLRSDKTILCSKPQAKKISKKAILIKNLCDHWSYQKLISDEIFSNSLEKKCLGYRTAEGSSNNFWIPFKSSIWVLQ